MIYFKKAGMGEVLSNIRRVSNLPFFLSKILEKAVLTSLMSHISFNNLSEVLHLTPAYKPYHSTETALLKVLNEVLHFIDQKKFLCFLCLTFQQLLIQ